VWLGAGEEIATYNDDRDPVFVGIGTGTPETTELDTEFSVVLGEWTAGEGEQAIEDERVDAEDDFTTGGRLEQGFGFKDDIQGFTLEAGGLGFTEGAGEELLGTVVEFDWELGLGLG